MPRFHLISFAAAIMVVIAGGNLAYGVNIKPDAPSAISPASGAVLIRGFHGGGARGVHRGGAVAVRGPHGGRAVGVHSSSRVAVHGGGRGVVRGPRGGGAVAVRGPHGGGAVVARGPHRVGSRYGGGVWYGTGRRYWGGRWWAYGVGSCWRWTDIGYVWICQ
jgi:hypothetical protein